MLNMTITEILQELNQLDEHPRLEVKSCIGGVLVQLINDAQKMIWSFFMETGREKVMICLYPNS